MSTLEHLLIYCAIFQCVMAAGNTILEKCMGWEGELKQVTILLRQVHRVHAWFITLILLFFAVLTFRFHREMACDQNGVLVWLTGGISIFWAIRLGFQLFYYDRNLWMGKGKETFVHVLMLIQLLILIGVYGWAAGKGVGFF